MKKNIYFSQLYFNMLIFLGTLFLTSCATTHPHKLRMYSEVQQGKHYFETGYYKRALHQLIGPACEGHPEAQYAIGYLFYYGYGTTQDTFMGTFWIARAANQGFIPAIKALSYIQKERTWDFKHKNLLRNDKEMG